MAAGSGVEPVVFGAIYKERVWGGRRLETDLGRELPDVETPFGEAWDVVDRPDDRGRVVAGEHAGRTLQELWTAHREELFGAGLEDAGPDFPMLLKILDARRHLSVQVHPPASVASELGGEAKTEMWYVLAADPGAKLFVGVKEGVTRESFERAVEEGRTEETLHVLEPEVGEFLLIPSGRLHAIGAGLVLFEMQQNSDTVYRVFDWDRLGLDGAPRQLHTEEALRCIDFSDVAPSMGEADGERLVDCEHFRVERWRFEPGAKRGGGEPRFALYTVVEGTVSCGVSTFDPGCSFLLPVGGAPLVASAGGVVLRTTLP
ncbi:MAG: type I phosphomannose isomerase catalytic subunit [Planctomycetota bacterium]